MSKRKLFRNFISNLSRGGQSNNSLIGGIEIITPSFLSGWIYDPNTVFTEVRLLMGSCLIGQAPINQSRLDVERKHNVSKNVGFMVKYSSDLPENVLRGDPVVFAMTVDGATRQVINLLGADSTTTSRLLKSALQRDFVGLDGHFDGLTSLGDGLHGWCFNRNVPTRMSTVYLQTSGIAPIPIECNRVRSGFDQCGYPENCGFYYPLSQLHDLGVASGSSIHFSYDREGLLRLPQTDVCAFAEVSENSLNLQPSGDQGLSSSEVLETTLEVSDVNTPEDLRQYWHELEQFKQYCDFLETELDEYEAWKSRNQAKTLRLLGKRVSLFGKTKN